MVLTGPDARVLQLHPSRYCNLSCLHCYSSSGPHERASIPVDILKSAIVEAKEEGYNVVSLSGGEPLMYGGLLSLLDVSRGLGLQTMIVTNGMRFDQQL